MTYPKNPETIVIQNEFYPKGLTEIDIWNYYQTEKYNITEQTRDRDVFFTIIVDGKQIIRRTTKNKKYIRLYNKNFDELITGRTISIHSTMNRYEDFGIVDIDCNDFLLAKKATLDVFKHLLDKSKCPMIYSLQIRFTGKTSFHIHCGLRRRLMIDDIKSLLQTYLLQNDKLRTNYTILHKRVSGIPNLDLAPNKQNGGFITLYSLNTIGLRCIPLDYNDVRGFRVNRAKI